jgi:hypothetical protein
MNKIDIASLLALVAFVWAAWSATRKPSRGTIWALTVSGVILGLVSGFTIAWRLYIPELRSVLGNAYTFIANDQLHTSMVSAAALTKLEDGKNAEAKTFLAGQVARYYRQLKDAKTLTAQEQKTLAHIEELSTKSESLRQKLAEQTKKQP